MSKFQVILIGAFGFIVVLSVILFSKYQGGGQKPANVLIWGTLASTDFQNILSKTSLNQSKTLQVAYEVKNPETIDSDFVEALAAGGGPDLIILPHEKIQKTKNKLTLIPYASYTERAFKDAFIAGGEIYLTPEGIVALPFILDPLVMYWNRSVFTDANLTLPPKYWDEFYSLAEVISKKDNALNIERSASSLGEFSNITNAKEIISNLLMQAGTPIVQPVGGKNYSVLANSFDKPLIPAEAAINFYTQFSNPGKQFYSWNRSMPKSGNFFLSGKLGIYFGFASELWSIQQKNPNLNFDVALVPSSREAGVNVSFAKFQGLAISKGSKNPTAALAVATILTSAEGIKAVNQALNLPPVRRDLLSEKQSSSYRDVFYRSAIRSNAWLDPDPSKTDAIFKEMVESITSGRERTSSAVSRASRQIGDLLTN